jgi:hypothetical protein
MEAGAQQHCVQPVLSACVARCGTTLHVVVSVPCTCRFAQFFISPLISADGVEREVKAVDSEVSPGRGWG